MSEKKYDVVVIGAGNGGLTAAIRVLQKNHSCLIVEKHNLPGGFATSFVRGRFEFEASLHELNDYGCDDNIGEIGTLFKELGVYSKLEWVRTYEAYRMITLDGKYDVTMPLGVDKFIEKMCYYVPEARKSITDFFLLAKEVVEAQTYSSSVNGNTDKKYMIKNFPNFIRCGSYSVNEVLNSLKMPKKAIDILNAYWCYLGVDCDRLSFLHYASMVYRYIKRYVYVPKLKSHGISLALEQRIRELNGDIYYNCEVEKILTDDDRNILGVQLKDGKVIKCDHIIANCSPTTVFGKLLDKRIVSEQEKRATNARKLSGRGISMFLGLNKSCDELNITNHNYFIYDTADTVKQYKLMESLKTNYAQATVCLNRAYEDCSPKGTTILYFTSLLMSDDFSNVSEHDYFKMKDFIAERFISTFEKATNTKIRDSIEEIAVATPQTYARYTSHPQGSIYGYETHTWDSLMPRMMMMKEDNTFKNLRFCGGFAMRSSGFSSAYISGDIVGRQTCGDIARKGR